MLRRFKQRAAIGNGMDVDDTRGMVDVDVLRDLFAGSATRERLGARRDDEGGLKRKDAKEDGEKKKKKSSRRAEEPDGGVSMF